MKTAELKGAYLNYWVAMALGKFAYIYESYTGTLHCVTTENGKIAVDDEYERHLNYSASWELGGPLIAEREICIQKMCPDAPFELRWNAALTYQWLDNTQQYGSTPLEAAMRAIVASVYGDEVSDIIKVKGAITEGLHT
jgi:hypothetical protein